VTSSHNMLREPKNWFNQRRALLCVEALKKKGFCAYYADTRAKAVNLILSEIPKGASVGIGGSVTIRELGIPELLKEQGHTVYDHWDPNLSASQKQDVRKKQITADVFLSSTNALTKDGTLVNTDGSGNRVAAMIFGPKITIVVCGINKIVEDLQHAVDRIRNYAAPINFKRLGLKFPCQEGSNCTACGRPLKGCRITTIIEAVPSGKEKFVVILVGENLGY